MKDAFNFYSPIALKSYNLNETMRYPLNLLGTLDVYTRKHSENVANITCRLCEYLHLSKSFTVYATICAYLHDVGKLFIPKEILQKPTRLTDEEYEVIKTHTTLGYEMCMKDAKLQPFAEGALYHHEALNGLGYPQGLKGDQIPMVGQIIRVADEYDAIVNKRQYKTHIGISDTLKIIIENTVPFVDTMDDIVKNAQVGKDNKMVVKALLRVVRDDTEYEISCIFDYMKSLKKDMERLEEATKYYEQMLIRKKEKDRAAYLETILLFLNGKETIDNFEKIKEDLKIAYEKHQKVIDGLFAEVKKIKKLGIS